MKLATYNLLVDKNNFGFLPQKINTSDFINNKTQTHKLFNNEHSFLPENFPAVVKFLLLQLP